MGTRFGNVITLRSSLSVYPITPLLELGISMHAREYPDQRMKQLGVPDSREAMDIGWPDDRRHAKERRDGR